MNQVYFSLSIIIGLVLIVDAIVLSRVNGKCGGHPILSITTPVEFFWAVASAIALYKIKFLGWPVLIPSLYLAHNVFGWGYGTFIISKEKEAAESGKIHVPIWYVYFGGTVGVVFSLASFLALWQ